MSDCCSFNSSLDKLGSKILKDKIFEFAKSELDFDDEVLIDAGIISVSGDQVTIKDYKQVIEIIIPQFKSLFNYEFSEDGPCLKVFLKQVDEYFGSSVLIGRTAFEQSMVNYCLKNFVNEHKGNLVDLAKTYSKTENNVYTFQQGLCNVLPELNLSTDSIIDLFSWLYEELKTEDPGFINSDIVSFTIAIRSFCFQNPLMAKDLFIKCIKSEHQILKPFHTSIIAANYDLDGDFITEITDLLKVSENQASIICSLGSITFTESTPIKQFIDLAERIGEITPSGLLEIPRFYCAMLEQIKGKDTELINHCFKKLSFLINSYPETVGNILFQLRFVKVYEKEITDLVLELVAEPNTPENILKQICDVFYNFESASYFFQALRQLALRFDSKFNAEDFKNTVSAQHSKNASDFDDNLITMLTDNEGVVRFVARSILSSLSRYNRKRKFNVDILQPTALNQYKLCVSLTEELHEPKHVIPFIITLLASKFDLVRALTLHRIEIMVENYFFETVEAMEDYLDISELSNKKDIEYIRTYAKNFKEQLKPKWDIKELDPMFTQYKYFKQFNIQSNRKLQENMDKTVKEKSLLSLFGSNVMLAKGGGWAIDNHKNVQQLSTIETKMSLPREYGLFPEGFDWQRKEEIYENWDNKFEPWEAMISL